jgi:hypothetical protein
MIEFVCVDPGCVNNDFVTEWPEGTPSVICVCGVILLPKDN